MYERAIVREKTIDDERAIAGEKTKFQERAKGLERTDKDERSNQGGPSMTQERRRELRALVRTMYDYQAMRIVSCGRLRQKADLSQQDEENMEDAIFLEKEYPALVDVRDSSIEIEKRLAKAIAEMVKAEPLWTAFLDGVKGCGPLMSAAIMAEFDIHQATTVSKMWQFAGLNPGTVKGKKRVQGKGKEFTVEVTDTMIRGDRRSPGFVSPYNGWLRTKLVGVLASCMIKSRSSYATDYYYPMKARLEQEENVVAGGEKAWKDESKGHRDNAAKRYMIKMFLKDLYVAWRTIEGLPVREPYQVEYLGKRHSA